MTHEQLQAFLVVVESGSFTRAAEALHLTQPAVSQQIHCLEKDLGHALFDRKGRSLVLTMAGRRVLQYAKDQVAQTTQLRDDLQQLDGKFQGVVRIGSLNSIGIYALPALIARFQREVPSVKIDLWVSNSDLVAERMLHGELDLAITDVEIAPSLTRNLRQAAYRSEEVLLALPPGHPWAGRADVRLDELYGQELIVRDRRSRLRSIVEQELAAGRDGLDPSRLRITLTLDSSEAIKQAVMAGLGIAFLPESTVSQPLVWGAIARARLASRTITRQLWLYSPTRSGLPPRVQILREFLLAHPA